MTELAGNDTGEEFEMPWSMGGLWEIYRTYK
jgi:hypothetical protein